MIKNQPLFIFILVCVMGMSACKTGKQLPYFKDLSDSVALTHLATNAYVPLRLQTDDEVQITISNSSPEASQFFNMTTPTPQNTVPVASLPGGLSGTAATGMSTMPSAQNMMNIYRVSYSGNITLPTLKDVKAAGLTTEELKAEILQLLEPYLKDAVVIIKLTNFKVTVIGEVGRPVVVPVNGQTINVLEAIGAAGDMTAFGIRKNVRIIRKLPDGNTDVALLDFNKSSTLQSPYFQLRQNDIVYITPSKNKSIAASPTAIWVSVLSAIASITAIILTRR